MPVEIGPALCAACEALTYWRCAECGIICKWCHCLRHRADAALIGITKKILKRLKSERVFPLGSST